MAITDLTDTTWKLSLGATSSYGSVAKFNINGTLTAGDYSVISNGGYILQYSSKVVFFGNASYSHINPNLSFSYGYDSNGRWYYNGDTTLTFNTDTAYLTITGGTDVANPALIAWLQEYGELQEEEETTDLQPVYKRVNGNWVKQNAYKRVDGKWVQISTAIPQLSAPTISLDEKILTITDNSGLATSFDILVDGKVKHTLSKNTRYFYNGVSLPKIPEDVLVDYPYCWIRNNTQTGYYDLLLSKDAWYLKDENTLAKSTTDTMWYRIAIASADTASEWVFHQAYSSLTWGNESVRRIMWSNYDIPNGSATATDIYFKGTEPVQGTAFDLSSLITESGTYSITVTAITDGYEDSEQSNAVEYDKITDLTGTTWYIPSGWSATAGYGQFNTIGTYFLNNEPVYVYNVTDLYLGYMSPQDAYQDAICFITISGGYRNHYSENTAFTFTFTGGTDVTNADLIAWLQKYGELQEQTKTITAGTYKFKDSGLTVPTWTEQAISFKTDANSYTAMYYRNNMLEYSASDYSSQVYSFGGGWIYDNVSRITIPSDANVTEEFYNWFTSNAEPSDEITDLTNTTWYVPSGWSASIGYGSFNVNGEVIIENTTYSISRIAIGSSASGGQANAVAFVKSTDNKIVWRTSDVPFTVTFTGGTDVTNTKLISWLYANGKLQ